MRRTADIFISSLFLVVGLPFILTIIVLDFLLTGRNPLFLQTRKLCAGSRPFCMIKIRTIINPPPAKGGEAPFSESLTYEEMSPYVPGFCGWLRKSGLDEMLQLVNVIRGEMSLVGPRPLITHELDIIKKKHPELHKRRERLRSAPGITGYWQIYGDRKKGFGNLVECDEFYEKNKSFYLDARIIIKTLHVMLTASHSDSILNDRKKETVPGTIDPVLK